MHGPSDSAAGSGADDAFLVARAKTGDRRAFGSLIARHEAPLRRAVAAITRHAADTDDVMQESVLKIWTHLHALDDTERPRAWMIRIASREALRLVMARRREDELHEEHAVVGGPDHLIERLDAQQRIRSALAALSSRQQRCWVLREVDGLSYRAIADLLDLPESTVRGLIASARKALLRAPDSVRAGGRPAHAAVIADRMAPTRPAGAVASIAAEQRQRQGRPLRDPVPRPVRSKGVLPAPG